MAFKKGEPTQGNAAALQRPKLKAQGDLSRVVRDKVNAEVMVDWHVAITMGHIPQVFIDELGEQGVRCTCCDVEGNKTRGAILPTLKEQNDAMAWLANRGYGLAPQTLKIERTETIISPVVAMLPLDKLRQLYELIGADDGDRGDQHALPASITDDAIDAAVAEVTEPADSESSDSFGET